MEKISFSPIGKMVCKQIYPQQQPRQGFYANNSGYIQLIDDEKIIASTASLEEFDYIWVIYVFSQNKSWKSFVAPPVKEDNKKVGVFASRSPYRPNQIGMSAVKLKKIEKDKIFIENFDLLNDTPILDIKPYISIYDSIENASNGWVKDYKEQEYKLEFSKNFLDKSAFVNEIANYDLKDLSFVQLRFNPTDSTKKRVINLSSNGYEIAFRTWRVKFICCEENKSLFLEDIYSGYSKEELLESFDKYNDKEYHRVFNNTFV